MLKVADVRQRYTRGRETEDADALAFDLSARFLRREQAEVARLKRVLDLVTHDGCQTNALVGYFGETARRALRPLHLLFDGPRRRPAADG